MINKPSTCSGCPLYDLPIGQHMGWVGASGAGTSGVLLIAEAAGEAEAESGVPLVGKAGHYLFSQLARVGLEREQFRLHNVLSCFTNARTSVLTSTGYRAISSLSVGDLVLTHRGRFRPILATHFLPRQTLPHYLVYLSDGSQHGVTEGHGWITWNGEIIPTEQLQIGDKIPGLCEVCSMCGGNFHRKFQPHPYSTPYCSRKCFNTAVARGSRNKIRQAMLDQYQSGIRDSFAITKAANAAMWKMVEVGTWTHEMTESGKVAHRLKSALAREAFGLKGATWIGHGETELHDLLTAAGYEPVPQFALNGYNYDFKIGNTLIEVDNPARDCQTVVKERRRVKDLEADANGFTVLHVPSNNITTALDLLKNDNHDYEFMPVTVVEIERRPDRPGVWSCEVEEDASYVVKGIAHHNCRPPNNKLAKTPYEAAAIAHCSPNLDCTIAEMQQQCQQAGQHLTILTLGRIAFKRVMGLDERDPLLKEDYLAYPHWSDHYSAWVIAAHHPSYLMRGNHHLLPTLQFAATRAIEIARDGLQLEKPYYLLDPGPETFQRWVLDFLNAFEHNPSLILSYDIETPRKQGHSEDDIEDDDDYTILRCSFCYEPGNAASAVWNAQNMRAFEQLFGSGATMLGYNNTVYDSPRVRKQLPIVGDEVDGMLAWHVLNSALPKGLGFVTPYYWQSCSMWKHLANVQPAYYNAKDADAALRCYRGTVEDLKREGLWGVFDRHVIQLNKALAYMSEKGVLRDEQMRQAAEEKVAALLEVANLKIQATIPAAALKLHPPHGYVRAPKNLDGLSKHMFTVDQRVCTACGLMDITKTHVKPTKPCEGADILVMQEQVERWAKPLEFKLSNDSLKRYQRVMRHKPIISRRERKITFDEGAMLMLQKHYPNDPLYPRVGEFRGLQKLLTTYIGTTIDGCIVGGMPTGPDGRIRTTFLHNPSTLRLSSQNPNLQNLPRPGGPNDLETIIRNLIVAAPGHTLYARDYSGIEAVLVGYEARSAQYIRLAKIDVHSFYTAYALNQLDGRVQSNDLPQLGWDDAKLAAHLGEIKQEFKRDRNQLFKHLIHAANFGQQAKGAAEKILKETSILYPVPMIAKLMGIYLDLFPEIKKWQTEVQLQADRDGYLRNAFDYCHRFNRVFSYEKIGTDWVRKPGDDADRVLAFRPQSNAAGIIKEALLTLFNEHFNNAGQFLRLQIHDELLFEVPKNHLSIVDHIVKQVMEAPLKQLPLPTSYGMGEYLTVATESKSGMRWGSMR